MNGKELKALRGQIRQIVKELLPEVLKSELMPIMRNELKAEINNTMKRIQGQVEESLAGLDKKVSDGVSYLVRHTGELPMKIKLDDKDGK